MSNHEAGSLRTRRDKFARFALLSLLALPFSTVAAQAKMPIAEIGDNKIQLEVAASEPQIRRGLMYRTALPEDNGMVFLFRPSHGVRFWMAHCFISLDMLMIKGGKIARIFENVPPCKATDESECPTYPASTEPAVEVSEVVEVNGGYAKRHGIKEGDTVKFLLPNGRRTFDLTKTSAKPK